VSVMPAPTGEVLRVSDALLGRIVAGTYPPGLRLPPEVSLSAELGCGRSTLREAIRHLSSLGLLKSRRGSGITVLDFRREGTLSLLPAYLAHAQFDHPLPVLVGELLQVRKMLAMEAARLAGRYAKEGSLAGAKKRTRRLLELEGEPAAHAVEEVELYRDLLVASAIWPAVWMANAFWEPLRDVHQTFAGSIGFVPAGHQTMLSTLFALLERREADRAVELVRGHFDAVDRTIMPRIESLFATPEARSR
jgi:GntR family transcriptional regulator, transcriptional repressor for pyruvate dehydrogenase complex